jgi:hypothetical protein
VPKPSFISSIGIKCCKLLGTIHLVGASYLQEQVSMKSRNIFFLKCAGLHVMGNPGKTLTHVTPKYIPRRCLPAIECLVGLPGHV